ncbi:MAG: aspartate-semialdehyde dehydrogenase [Firmicutes bacterium]|nr:aspartate-semialdehyde dehydrogenase [Bacillota bacterium]
MRKQYRVGVIGATGMVGQRFVTLLADHPWFNITAVAASSRSAGQPYGQAVAGRWMMPTPVPQSVAQLTVLNATQVDEVARQVDFVFCAVEMDAAATRELEDSYARAGIPVVSNNSAHRGTPDVPMLIPEINPQHLEVIPAQQRRLGSQRGFVVVKPNCSLQSYVPAIHALMEFEPTEILACTYQAISGAGKAFDTWPEMVDNVIPYIAGEEAKSEQEPLKIWGQVEGGAIRPAQSPRIATQCIRVPVSDGHLAAVFVNFAKKPSREEILARWATYQGEPQQLRLPSAPQPFIQYLSAADRPQTKLDRDFGYGMGITVGRLRADTIFDYKFVCLSHNTLRGAAGGAILNAELLAAKGYFD